MLALAVIVLPLAVHAQTTPTSADDIAAIEVPDVSMPKDKAAADALIANGWKYFFFHKPGVSFDAATTDIAICQGYVPQVAIMALPGYSNLSAPAAKFKPGPTPYGLVGAALADTIGRAINKTLERRDRVSRYRRCMETRGYTRYPMAEAVWDKYGGQEPAREIAVFAKLASGPKPDLPVPTK